MLSFVRGLPLVCLCLVLSVGCSAKVPNHNPVKGKVTFQKKPATGALIVFTPRGDNRPEAIRASAYVADDGSYELETTFAKGAPAGDYDVTIFWELKQKEFKTGLGGEGESAGGPDKLGGKYSTPGKSGLTATVKAGPNEIPSFDL